MRARLLSTSRTLRPLTQRFETAAGADWTTVVVLLVTVLPGGTFTTTPAAGAGALVPGASGRVGFGPVPL